MAPVARALRGEPNEALSSRDELRFGTRGSLSVDRQKGVWADHETGEAGGVIDFVKREKRVDKAGALAFLREAGHIAPSEDGIAATYDYRNEAGEMLFQVVRRVPKDFRQRRSDGAGGWVWKMTGVRRVVYRLPELIAAIGAGEAIYIAEGEKGVEAVVALGLVATCSPGGAGKWRNEYAPHLRGARVVILPDNDEPGLLHGAQVAASLRAVASSIRILNLPDLPEKGDVADWVAAGGTRELLEELAQTAPKPETVVQAKRSTTTPPKVAPSPNDDAIATVRVVNGKLAEAVSAGEAALIAADSGIYQRSTFIVRPGIVRVRVASGGKAPAQHILVVGEAALTECLTSACPWEVYDGRSEAYVRKDAPAKVVKALLGRVGQWMLPVLAGIINGPTLRADGSILDAPGYDAATGLLFDPQGQTFPPIPPRPTLEDAKAAMAILCGLIDTFPFCGRADESVALSAMLTASIRFSLPTAPMHCFTAPTAGSGKSMLADLSSMIATGREAGVIAQGKDEAELEKRLGALLLAGDAVIAIDNVEQPLGGEFLCQVLTQTTVRARILGKSQAPELPSSAFITATGNNLTLVGDVIRRSLMSSIDAKCERPELRTFTSNPVEIVRLDRGRYLVACLTVLRAFEVAGKPSTLKHLGSFGAWSARVRDALTWCGYADPTETMEMARASDPVIAGLTSVIECWNSVLGTERVTVKKIIDRATLSSVDQWGRTEFAYPEFREALLVVAGAGGAVNSERLGKWLRACKDRVINHHVIRNAGVTMGAASWKLEAV